MNEFILNLWNCYTLIDAVLILVLSILSIVLFSRLKKTKLKLNKYQFYSTVSAQTLEDHGHQVKLQECRITELKKAFEDAIIEITELRSKNKQLIYWKERALHYKHTKKVIDSEYWKCTKNKYNQFEKDKTYKKHDSLRSVDGFIFLYENEDHLHPFLVEKKYFDPIQK